MEFLDENDNVLFVEERLGSNLLWLGAMDVPIPTTSKLKLSTVYTPTETSEELFGYATVQPTKIWFDGELFIDKHLPVETDDPFVPLMDPPFTSKKHTFEVGKPVHIEIEVDWRGRTGLQAAAQNFIFGIEADASLGDKNIADAVAAAKASDLAIVVVGTNSKVESEGLDRKNLDLPGRQNELVEAVVAVNPNTIVVVNSGSPVLLPWRHKVRAVLLTYFGGQEMGNALVDMLSGTTEPGGRLPTTWADKFEDVPVTNCDASQPGNHVTYEEGIHIGYRAWLKSGVKPAYEFGYGLGYTTWSIDSIEAPGSAAAGEDFSVKVQVTNTGSRSGKHVVQIYASRSDSKIDRPVRWLVGFAEVHANAGESKQVEVKVRGRELANYESGWQYESGTFELHAASSVSKIEASASLTLN